MLFGNYQGPAVPRYYLGAHYYQFRAHWGAFVVQGHTGGKWHWFGWGDR